MCRELQNLNEDIVRCTRCPRLVQYREEVAQKKKRAFRDWNYWGKPVPGFGDPGARLLVVGLAPAAHGANRTGRMFTGDRSGEWLYKALFLYGFSNQPDSHSREDNLNLSDCYITAILRCAPPKNRPTAEEIRNCLRFLDREMDILRKLEVFLALGRIAFQGLLRLLRKRSMISPQRQIQFGHGALFSLENPEGKRKLLAVSYHPSQQNTLTGRLREEMFHSVFAKIRLFLSEGNV